MPEEVSARSSWPVMKNSAATWRSRRFSERLAHDSRSRSRFLLEAEVTGGLEHPGVVPVYSLGRYPDGRPYYAMRFIKGQSLGRRHRGISSRRGTRSRQPACSCCGNLLRRFLDVCNAIDYAHSRGVLHRDLKPGNIMLGKYGETLVVDWGLAKAVGVQDLPAIPWTEGPIQPISGSGTAETMPGSAIGTPQFMSPEQAAGDLAKIGPASDVYSLGATLYCVLTCHTPFEDRTCAWSFTTSSAARSRRLDSHEPSIPHRLQADLPEGDGDSGPRTGIRPRTPWRTTLSTGWPTSRSRRYRENFFGQLTRWGRRHRIWVQAGAAALAAVAIVATVAAVKSASARDKRSWSGSRSSG